MSEFKVGREVALKSGLTGFIQSVSTDEDGLLYVVHCDIDSFVYDTHRRASELALVAPADDELTRLRAENSGLLAENARLQKWLDDIHAEDIMVFQHATVYDYIRAGVVAFKVRDIDVGIFERAAKGHTQMIVTVYPVAAAEEALKPETDGGA